jgi:hypothetical protein
MFSGGLTSSSSLEHQHLFLAPTLLYAVQRSKVNHDCRKARMKNETPTARHRRLIAFVSPPKLRYDAFLFLKGGPWPQPKRTLDIRHLTFDQKPGTIHRTRVHLVHCVHSVHAIFTRARQ